ncbi:hypothetical protein [Chitinophaga japonensis]|uniref:Uncharacterized protein n=1 Tax=Chitinophaga japonensis TaxID=104662 RepID=A0A562SZ93_CHIJA|nr:hypothetical protein [Chitinophaga japonensis]TWI86334.1 hypothetical protein LX66_3588 [Chitinophaga japonensis]
MVLFFILYGCIGICFLAILLIFHKAFIAEDPLENEKYEQYRRQLEEEIKEEQEYYRNGI